MEPRKIYLTESQFRALVEQSLLDESAVDIIQRVSAGVLAASLALTGIAAIKNLSEPQKQEIEAKIVEAIPEEEWKMIADDVTVTVYNAIASQCNADVQHTASMFKLDLNNPASHKIIAMERTMMSEFGLKYGDIVKIEGTHNGVQDGVYQIQDTMNKRFAGQHKIDVLVSNDIHTGGTLKGAPAKVYVLNDKKNADTYRLDMAPEYKGNKNI